MLLNNRTFCTSPIYGVVTILLLSGLSLTATASKVLQEVDTISLQEQTNVPMIPLYGHAIKADAEVVRSDLAGYVRDVVAKPGSYIQEGQSIVLLSTEKDKEKYKAVRTEKEALYQKIESTKQTLVASRKALRQQKQRLENLKNPDVGVSEDSANRISATRQQYQNEIASRETLIAKLEEKMKLREQALEGLNVEISKQEHGGWHTLRSRSRGFVKEVKVGLGQVIEKGSALLTMKPVNPFSILVTIPENTKKIVTTALEKKIMLQGVLHEGGQEIPIRLEKCVHDTYKNEKKAVFKLDHARDMAILRDKTPVFIQLKLPQVPKSYIIPASALYYRNSIYTLDSSNRLEIHGVKVLREVYDKNGIKSYLITTTKSLHKKQVLISRITNAITGMQVETKADEV